MASQSYIEQISHFHEKWIKPFFLFCVFFNSPLFLLHLFCFCVFFSTSFFLIIYHPDKPKRTRTKTGWTQMDLDNPDRPGWTGQTQTDWYGAGQTWTDPDGLDFWQSSFFKSYSMAAFSMNSVWIHLDFFSSFSLKWLLYIVNDFFKVLNQPSYVL